MLRLLQSVHSDLLSPRHSEFISESFYLLSSLQQILKQVQDDIFFGPDDSPLRLLWSVHSDLLGPCHSEFISESFSFYSRSLLRILKQVQDDILFSLFCHSEFISESFFFTSRSLQQILKQVQDDERRVKFFPSWLTLLFYGRGKRHENFPHQWSGRMKIFEMPPR